MEEDTPTLLIVSGGIEAADAAKRAREMGLHVVVSDIDPNAPGFALAGDKRPSGAMVLATGKNREEALAAAKAGLSAIEIETR
jgi:xanthine/CO dehydrogenase XdhC/CoxF family maturation factor